MSTVYNKHINTLESLDEYGAYLRSSYVGSPNVAYITGTDELRYRKGPIDGKEAVGSVYYSDGTCTLPDEDVDTTKTPIGVVVSTALESPFGDYKTRIMSLLEPNAQGVGQSSNQKLIWSTSNIDTPLNNYSNSTAVLAAKEDGKVNTATLVNTYGAEVPAAYACSLYSTAGTNAGDWYLPSGFELKECYYDHKTIIDASINNIKTACGSSAALSLGSANYWSASECSSNNAWNVKTGNGYVGNGSYKSYDLHVRAFLAV